MATPRPRLNDPAIRAALVRKIYDEVPGVRVRHEMRLGRRVADVVHVDLSELHVYEIKSDRDGTGRLASTVKKSRRGRTYVKRGQVDAYSLVADRATLVVGLVLLEKALPLIPPWWGVLVAQDTPSGVSLTPHRAPQPNPARNWAALERLLWKAEALALCEALGLARGVRSATRRGLRARLASSNVPYETLHAAVIRALRSRPGWARTA